MPQIERNLNTIQQNVIQTLAQRCCLRSAIGIALALSLSKREISKCLRGTEDILSLPNCTSLLDIIRKIKKLKGNGLAWNSTFFNIMSGVPWKSTASDIYLKHRTIGRGERRKDLESEGLELSDRAGLSLAW